MTAINLKLQPLTRADFAPFGEVIEATGTSHDAMNAGCFKRYTDLATIDVGTDGQVCVSIAVCESVSRLPVSVECIERHPKGSQAFIPLTDTPMMLVVARAGPVPGPDALSAFISNGKQGINYFPGVWHMPMIALEIDQRILIIDRNGPGDNCDVHYFRDHMVTISE